MPPCDGERGLGDADARGRPPEVQRLADRDERPQVPELHELLISALESQSSNSVRRPGPQKDDKSPAYVDCPTRAPAAVHLAVLSLVLLISGWQVARKAPTVAPPAGHLPVISVVWTYSGLPAQQMEAQVTQFSESPSPATRQT